MLIDRMKTNPEEFVDNVRNGESKWGRLIGEYRGYLPKEDLVAFDDAHKEAIFQHMRQRFTEKVMEELIDPKFDTNPYLAPSAGTITLTSGNVTLATPIAGVTQTI